MKKIMAIILALTICFCFCACGQSKTLTEEDVVAALEECEGTLDVQTSGKRVKSFTFVVSDVDTALLLNKNEYRQVVNTLMVNPYKLTFSELNSTEVFLAVINICGLFTDDDDDFDAAAFTEEGLDIISDGKKVHYGSWTISAEINSENETITFLAKS